MTDPCVKVRITEVGGFAGNVPRPPRVDLARGRLGETQARGLDEACRQLLALAGQASPPAQVGADIHGYRVEIEAANGEMRVFNVPHSGRLRGGASGSPEIGAVIERLESLSSTTE